MTHYVIIVAGGVGSRMKNDIPKQFMPLQGRPILMHTLAAFHQSARKPGIILVLNEKVKRAWGVLCHQYHFNIPHSIVTGGATRFHSVKNGLSSIFHQEKELKNVLIAIHDGVRPLVSDQLIERAYTLAEKEKTAIPAIQSPDSIRIKQTDESYTSVHREKVFQIQTPQVFTADILKEAFEQAYKDIFTDDASVVEHFGFPIQLMDGEIQNIKITYPTDLPLAEYWLKAEN